MFICAAPEIETSAKAAEVIVAATAAINNCFFMLFLRNILSNVRIISNVCSQLVVEIVRIIRICFQMSTLICKKNTNKCKLTTNIPIFCLKIALKAFCSKVFAIF
jgi:hypothetical protein